MLTATSYNFTTGISLKPPTIMTSTTGMWSKPQLYTYYLHRLTASNKLIIGLQPLAVLLLSLQPPAVILLLSTAYSRQSSKKSVSSLQPLAVYFHCRGLYRPPTFLPFLQHQMALSQQHSIRLLL
jgi:hypothetical protein